MFNTLFNLGGPRAGINVEMITPEEAKQLIDNDEVGLLLDVRTPGEYAGGHAPDATLAPLDSLAGYIPDLMDKKEELTLVYCRTQNRSAMAATMLKSAGFENVKVIGGGIMGWAQAGLPIAR